MKRLRGILKSSEGFTLVELLVSVTIMTVVVGIFGAAMFQVLSIQRFWTDDIKATREIRHAGSWFAGDALNATEVYDDGGSTRLTCTPSPDVEQVTLAWTDTSAVDHTSVYSIVGTELQRNFDSSPAPLILATGVVADTISFTLCDKTLRMIVSIQADRETTDTLDLITYVRKLS